MKKETHDCGDEWFTVPQAVQYTKISRSKLYSLMAEHTLPYYHVTGTDHRRLKKTDLDKLMVPVMKTSSDSEDAATSE